MVAALPDKPADAGPMLDIGSYKLAFYLPYTQEWPDRDAVARSRLRVLRL